MITRAERINDPEEVQRLAMEYHQSTVWTALPAIVHSVDFVLQTIMAQPALKGAVTDAAGITTQVNLPLLCDVPIVWPRAGGFGLTFPIAVGDEVLVIFASRCIDSWWQTGEIEAPLELRMHDLSDGFAVLAPTSQPKALANVSAENVQLRDAAGTTFLEITKTGRVRIVAASEINVEAPTITLSGNVVHSGGSIKSLGKVIDGTHTHADVQPGSGITGQPN